MNAIETIQSILGSSWQPLFIGITYLGSIYAYIALLTLYYWLVDPHTGRQLGILLGLTYATNLLVKDWSERERPFKINPDIASEAAKSTANKSGLPSGHAQGSATFWFFLAWYYQRIWLWVLGIVVVVLVSFSRVYLGVHYPIDVVVGLIMGIVFAGIGILVSFPKRKGLIIGVVAVILAFILTLVLPYLGNSLGTLVGFFLTRPQFTPPRRWKGRLILGGGGLIIVFLFYFLSDWALNALQIGEWMDYWRYLLLTLLATEVCPRLAFRIYNDPT